MPLNLNFEHFFAPSSSPPSANLGNPLLGMSATDLICRCCGSKNLQLHGRLPDVSIFAGTQMRHPLLGGKLYRCKECEFVFRSPLYDKRTYDLLYRAGIADTWEDEIRIDHVLVRALLQAHLVDGSVLDVGCSTGKLLQPLVNEYACFGVEINTEASDIAEANGIHIVGHDLEKLAELPRRFDAVMSCDVIEHVANPLEFMRLLLAKTNDSGLVIISTGNAMSWSWRLFGSRFWYCYLPEHLSFISPAWFKHFTKKVNAGGLDADIVQTECFVYSPEFSWPSKALRLGLMALFRISPRLYYALLPQAKRHHIPVGRGVTRDHFVIVLRKRKSIAASAEALYQIPDL